ncbi:MAG: hypothetical protein JXB14_00970 [Candidatus Altiarchaeota archaeon]|nr:hypothetical protein [Candidatus Altiarchaeota archaeon]
MKKLLPLALLILFAVSTYSQTDDTVRVEGGAPILTIVGFVLILIGVFLIYKLWKTAGGAETEYDKLNKRVNQLKELIERTKYDFFKRRVAEDKADKLIREYEEEIKQTTRRIEELKSKFDIHDAHLGKATKPRNLLIVTSILIFMLAGLLFLSQIATMFEESGGGYDQIDQKQGDLDPMQAMQICPTAESQRDIAGCFSEAARMMANEDFEYALQLCAQIEDSSFASECLLSVAENIDDGDDILRICTRVEDPQTRQNCCNRFFFGSSGIRMQYADQAVQCCGNLSDDADAQQKYCENVARDLSRSNLTKAAEICALVKDVNSKDDCYHTLAREQSSSDAEAMQFALELCAGISDTERRDNCYGDISRNAKGSNPPVALEACKRISSKDKKGDCSPDSMGPISVDQAIELCLDMGNENEKSNCLNNIAYRYEPEEAIAACDYMPDPQSENCYQEIARRVQNNATLALKFCGRIDNELKEDECIREVARNSYGLEFSVLLEICRRISQPQKVNDCVNEAVYNHPQELLEDVDSALAFCKKMPSNQRDNCYYNIARSIYGLDKGEASDVCDLMKDEWRVKECKRGNFN